MPDPIPGIVQLQQNHNLPRYRVLLRNVTPVLMAGADNGTPELRAASFRGVLRYWTRAILGAHVGASLDPLRLHEASFFGDTKIGSTLAVDLQEVNRSQTGSVPLMLPNRANAQAEGYTDVRFQLIWTIRPGLPVQFGDIHNIIEMMVNLGGVGKRSRRGFGSLQILQRSVGGNPFTPTDGNDLAQGLAALVARVVGTPAAAISTIPPYPVLHPKHCKILACKQGHSTYEGAMNVFWNARGRGNAAFATDRPRRASALHLHITKGADGLFYPVMTVFRTTAVGDWPDADTFLQDVAASHDGTIIYGGSTQW